MKRLICASLCSVAWMLQTAHAQHSLARVDPVQDRANPAAMHSFQIPSHGSMLNALIYIAAGAGPHPAVILLHGFPGNERNLDLAQEIRRAGWDVLYFNYRGAWGSPGDFSFSHGIEDTAAALAYLRQPDVAKQLRLDPSRIVLIGHSMGGFMAVEGTAADDGVIAMGLISAADLGGRIRQPMDKDVEQKTIEALSKAYANEGMAPLAGCTPEGLARETVDHGIEWRFLAKAAALKSRPVLIVTSDDGLTAANDAFASALDQVGNRRVKKVHLATDHSYSDQRLALSAAVIEWLSKLDAKK